MGFTSSAPRALTVPAALPPLSFHPDSDLSHTDCPYCIVAQGLCNREDCRRQVLPQLARPTGLLRLIGEARVEQTKRQTPTPTERAAVEKAKRRTARKIARSQRRGYFGLAKAIMERKA